MHDLIAVVALFTGIPLFVIGWVMSVIAARKFDTKWVVGMVLVFPVTLMMLVLIHWGSAKKPLLVTIIGAALILVTVYYLPETETMHYVPGQK